MIEPHAFIEEKIAHTLALAVRRMAANEAWVKPSAATHSGRIIAVHASVFGRPLHLAWRVDADAILVRAPQHSDAHVTLTLMPSIYAALAELPFDMNRLMRHVRIEGDAGLAEWVNRLAQQLRPDVWEDLSALIGDTPTHFIAQGAGFILGQLKKTAKSLTQQAQYVVLDESPIWVRHAHLEDFAQDAQNLRYALDRLEQRVAQLKARS
jgi:ubiquinone biosynthesis accessory factor UbiJ